MISKKSPKEHSFNLSFFFPRDLIPTLHPVFAAPITTDYTPPSQSSSTTHLLKLTPVDGLDARTVLTVGHLRLVDGYVLDRVIFAAADV